MAGMARRGACIAHDLGPSEATRAAVADVHGMKNTATEGGVTHQAVDSPGTRCSVLHGDVHSEKTKRDTKTRSKDRDGEEKRKRNKDMQNAHNTHSD